MAPMYHDSHRLDAVAGKSVFDYADSLKVRVPTSCGRTGECHECIVEIKRGMPALNSPTPSEGFDTFEDAGAALVRATDMSEAETLESDNSIARLSVHENVTSIWIADALEARPELLIRGEKHGPRPAGRCKPEKLLNPAGP